MDISTAIIAEETDTGVGFCPYFLFIFFFFTTKRVKSIKKCSKSRDFPKTRYGHGGD